MQGSHHSQGRGQRGSQQLQPTNHYQGYQHLPHQQLQQMQQQQNPTGGAYPPGFYNNVQQNVGRPPLQQQSPPQHLQQQPSNYIMRHGQHQQQIFQAPQTHQANPQRSARSDKNSQQQLYTAPQGGGSAPQQQPLAGQMPRQMVNLMYGPGGQVVGGMQQEHGMQQYVTYENQPSDRNVILTNRSNTANTVNTHVSCSQHKTARSQGTACSQSQNQSQQNQSHSSHHKKSKKKHSGRLPPPKVRIQQPNFNNMGERNGGGENSNSYSDQQEEMGEIEQRQQQRDQQQNFLMHQSSPEYAGMGAHQPPYHGGGAAIGQALPPGGSQGANVAAAVNHDSYVNESISVLYAQNSNSQAQYQGQSSRANSYRDQGNDGAGVGPSSYGNVHPAGNNMAPPMQPLGFVGPHRPMHEEEKAEEGDPFMDTEKKQDMEFMMDWNFAQGSVDNSMDDRRPSQLEDVRPGGQQPSSSNNDRLYNQNNSDYITQPNQQHGLPNQHLSSQNEDNSRYTELSSIRPDSVTDGQHLMAQNQYASHPQHGARGPGGGPSGQRHPPLPSSGPHQVLYGNDYGQNNYQLPPKQQRRDHDSLLNRVQAVENQTKAEIQQINNPMGPQGNGGDLEPELSLSQLEEQDPIKKMINEESIIEEDLHEDDASGIGECLDCVRENANDIKKKKRKQKKNSGRPCKHQRQAQPPSGPQQNNFFSSAAEPPQQHNPQPNNRMGGAHQEQNQHLMANNFAPPRSQEQQPNNVNDDQASRSYSSRSNDDDDDDEDRSRNTYDESSSCTSDESGEYIFHDDPSAEQDDPNNRNGDGNLRIGGPYYGVGQNSLMGQQIGNNNSHGFNRNMIGRNGQPSSFYGPNGELVQQSHSRESHLLPIQFAKEHIIKIEEDMKKMHERHVKLMREMDQNYKLIEEETQEYYIEFLRKWKEVAKQRILQYRKNTESLSQEKERIEKEKNAEIDSLVMQRNKLLKEKKEILEQNNKSITDRDNEMENQRIQFDQKLKKQEQMREQEMLSLQNEKKKLDLQVTEVEARYKAETEQLKIQNEQLNAQVDELQAQEEGHAEDIENLKVQIDNLKEQEKVLKEQTEKLKAEVDLKDNILKSKVDQLDQKNRDQAEQHGSIEQKTGRIAELEALVEQLQNQVAQMTAFNTQSSIKSVASAVQGGAVNQDQGQISSSHVNQQWNTEKSQEPELKSQQLNPTNPVLIQRIKKAGVRIRNPTGERDQSSGSQPPVSTNQQQQQSILAQINQQNLKSSFKIKAVRGQSGKDIVLKPASIMQNQSFNSAASVGSAASALAGGVGSAANSRTRQNLFLVPPMSEQDFLSKQSNIQKVYQQKLDEIKHLKEHFSMRISCFQQQNQRGEIDHGAEEQIEFDVKIKERLQKEENEYKTEMNEEVAKLKKTYEQSQRAQIQQKNIQQNRNSSLQFAKRSDLNSSNLDGGEPLLANKNPTKIQASLKNFKKNFQLNKVADNPYSNNSQPVQDHVTNTDTASSSKSNPPAQSDTLSSNIKIVPQGQLLAGSALQQTSGSIQNRQLLPVASGTVVSAAHNINSAREPGISQSMRVQGPQADEHLHSQQTLLSVNKELQKKIAELTKQTDQLKNQNQELQKAKESLAAKERDLEAELKDVKSSFLDMSALNSQLQEKSRIDNSQVAEQCQREAEELKKALKNGKQEFAKKLTYAKTQMDQLKKITISLRDEKTQFKGKIKSQEAVIEKLTQQNEEICQQLRQDLVAAKSQHKDLIAKNDQLWLRYQAETIHRKRLHNTIEDMKGKIRVYCRLRPMNQNEKKMGCIDAISLSDPFTLRIRVKKDQSLYKHDQSHSSAAQQAQYQLQEFQFDSCFDQAASQEAIFQDTKMLIQSAIDGYNVCIFAYGQTGSGKTYTVTGVEGDPGIVPRSFSEMFDIKERLERDNHFTVSFSCYMVELYLDKLLDLLAPDGAKQSIGHHSASDQLKIREDPQTGMIFIQNVNHRKLNKYQDAVDIFNLGLKSRKVGATGMNDHSSRSHLVFSVVVEARNNNNGEISSGKISFVDLAGSERASKSNPGFNYERQKESNAINLSLKYLGDVISCLSNEELPKTHVPYLNNKLTHLMKDSLGGRAKTLMFVNISPADWNAQESLNSLQFGHRVKMVQNDVRKNVETEATKKLKAEITELKRRLGD